MNIKKINLLNQELSFYVVSILLFVTFAAAAYSLITMMLDPAHINFFLNPDLNTYPYLMHNLVYQHGQFNEWHNGSALDFFPELVFLFVVMLFTTNPFTNLMLFSLFQIFVLSVVFTAIFKTATKTLEGFRWGIFCLLVFFITILIKQPVGNIYGVNSYIGAIFAPGFHFGSALLVFLSLFLFLKILSTNKFYLKFLLFILLVLGGISDPLIYIYFTMPITITVTVLYFFKEISLKNCFQYLFLFVAAFIVAYLSYHFLPSPNRRVDFAITFQWGYLAGFVKTMQLFFETNAFAGVMWLAFVIWAPFSLWKTLVTEKNSNYKLIDFVILFQWITLIVTTPFLILTIGQILPPDYDIMSVKTFFHHPRSSYAIIETLPYRYLINYLLGPTCFGFSFLLYKHLDSLKKFNNNKVYAGILILLTAIILFFKPYHIHPNNLFTYQPAFVKCLDIDAKKYHLTNGLANSYYAETLMNSYNTENIHVALVSTELVPLLWQNTLQEYLYSNYNFAISESKTIETNLTQRFGKPSIVATCPGDVFDKEYIFIYKNHNMDHVFSKYVSL